MANVNPYQAPAATVADPGSDTQPVKLFSVSGRIGRARYIAYGFGLYLIFGLVAGIAGAALGEVGIVVLALGWVALICSASCLRSSAATTSIPAAGSRSSCSCRS